MSDDFPTRTQLWNGAILTTIAHAVFLASSAYLSNEVSWDGQNYNRQDSQGTRGTITFSDTFSEPYTVAVFRDDHSHRAPWHSGGSYSISPFLLGMPKELRDLADKEALQYVLDDVDGRVQPVITAAFWGTGEPMLAAEAWQEVAKHGAHLLRMELGETEVAFAACEEEYEFGAEQMQLVRSLYNSKISSSNTPVYLTTEEYNVLIMLGTVAIEESRQLLASINIFWL